MRRMTGPVGEQSTEERGTGMRKKEMGLSVLGTEKPR